MARARSASPAARMGHHFVIGLEPGVRLTDHDRRLLAALRPVGAVLFRDNFAHGRPYADWLAELAALLAEVRRLVGRERLLVGIDHEGGRVVRTPPPITAFAAPRRWRERAGAVGEAMGRELAALGCNLDFAPVVDVDSNPANPIIGERAFGRTPDEVVGPARAFLAALQAQGVLGCLKHFPGHGDTATDSHTTLPVVDADLATLRRRELAPFAALADAAPLVMTAHVLYPQIDAERPATLSPRILRDLLRGEVGFAGVVISDDLGMAAVSDLFAAPGAAVDALLAGNDLLLICAQRTDTARALELASQLARGLDAGRLPRAIEDSSRQRIEALLARAPQHAVTALPAAELERHRALSA